MRFGLKLKNIQEKLHMRFALKELIGRATGIYVATAAVRSCVSMRRDQKA